MKKLLSEVAHYTKVAFGGVVIGAYLLTALFFGAELWRWVTHS